MTRMHPNEPEDDRPAFDPRRSAEIRSLLVRTVAETPTPRRARLSRAAFSLAASAALLFAGGIGAGTVVAYDRLVPKTTAEDASASAPVLPATSESLDGQNFEPRNDAGQGPESESIEATGPGTAAADTDLPTRDAGDLIPIFTLNGETGYFYQSDLRLVGHVLSGGVVAHSADSFSASAPQVPIYRADGVSVLGFFDPAALVP